MGDILTLDDGRAILRGSRAITGVLFLTAQELPEDCARLKRWLMDVSDRPNGCASIDLRGLASTDRDAFHTAARAAFQTISVREDIDRTNSVTYHALRDVVLMLDSIARGDPPDTPPANCVSKHGPTPEDLDEIWFEDE